METESPLSFSQRSATEYIINKYNWTGQATVGVTEWVYVAMLLWTYVQYCCYRLYFMRFWDALCI
jgi:hypothetical protein